MRSGSQPREDASRLDHPPDDPTLSKTVPDRSLAFRCLGFALRLETNDARIEHAARESFGPTVPGAARETPDCTIRLLVHSSTEAAGWRPSQPLIREQSGYFTITSSRSTTVAGDCERGFAFGFLSSEAADNIEFLRSAIIQSTFFRLVTQRTMAAIHSAVVWKNSTTLMLRGAPNAGKSTLAYAALKLGYSMVAEDVVFVRAGERGLELHGVPWSMYLKPDAPRFFPELAGEAPVERFNGEMKIRVDLTERFPGQTRQCTRPGPTVFVGRSTDLQDHLVRLDRDEVLRLLHSTAIDAERRDAEASGLWEELLKLPAYRLEVGNDPERAVRKLETLLSGWTDG